MTYPQIDQETNLPLDPSLLIANTVSSVETTTNLAANANFTGASHDGGAVYQGYNHIRVLVAATAGMGHGHLALEQSTDGVSWRETFRLPVPSDGNNYKFMLPLILRFARIRFYNGAVAQTAFYVASALVPSDGSDDFNFRTVFMHTQTALGAAGSFTGVPLNISTQNSYITHRAYAFADQAGTLYLEQSMDGMMWRTSSSLAVPANTFTLIEDKLIHNYCRVRYVNGATANVTFEVMSTLIHG